VQPLGRAAKMQLFGDRDETGHGPDIHLKPLMRYAYHGAAYSDWIAITVTSIFRDDKAAAKKAVLRLSAGWIEGAGSCRHFIFSLRLCWPHRWP
jgi:hypothetical protein